MKTYVLGFAFTAYGAVILRRMRDPDWQRGRLNGVGGRLADGLTPADAANTHFWEKTGIKVKAGQWRAFCRLSAGPRQDPRQVTCLALQPSPLPIEVEGRGPGDLELWPADRLPAEQVLPDLKWLIPLALASVHEHKLFASVVVGEYTADEVERLLSSSTFVPSGRTKEAQRKANQRRERCAREGQAAAG